MTCSYATLPLRLVLIFSLALGSLATVSSVSPAPPAVAKEGKGKGGEEGRGGDKNGNSGKGKSGNGHGKPEKAGKAKRGDDKGESGQNGDDKRGKSKGKSEKKGKKDKGGSAENASGEGQNHGTSDNRIEVVAVVVYSVNVGCEASGGQTVCQFTPQASDGSQMATHLVIPTETLCTPVVGGDAQRLEPDLVTGISGYASTEAKRGLALIFDGQLSLGGQATYWVEANGAIVPAIGPGLTCPQYQLQAELTPIPQPTTRPQPTLPPATPESTVATPEPTTELTDTTGSVVVEVFNCPIATEEADFEWFGECESAAEGERFRIVPASEETTDDSLRAVTDPGGHARFSQLEPGIYVLTQVERDWCHAKSDGVDADGNVIVRAGQRTTVWVFTCAGAAASPETSP